MVRKEGSSLYKAVSGRHKACHVQAFRVTGKVQDLVKVDK
jgi:hypothetical protein